MRKLLKGAYLEIHWCAFFGIVYRVVRNGFGWEWYRVSFGFLVFRIDLFILKPELNQVEPSKSLPNTTEGTKLTEQFLLDYGFNNVVDIFGEKVETNIFSRTFKVKQPNLAYSMSIERWINDPTVFAIYGVLIVKTEEQFKAIWKQKSGGEEF